MVMTIGLGAVPVVVYYASNLCEFKHRLYLLEGTDFTRPTRRKTQPDEESENP